jgi:hypothetical protein
MFLLHFILPSMRHIIVITQFQVDMAMNCRALTFCINIRYVAGHKRASSLPLQRYFDYSMSTDTILMWICKMYCSVDGTQLIIRGCYSSGMAFKIGFYMRKK